MRGCRSKFMYATKEMVPKKPEQGDMGIVIQSRIKEAKEKSQEEVAKRHRLSRMGASPSPSKSSQKEVFQSGSPGSMTVENGSSFIVLDIERTQNQSNGTVTKTEVGTRSAMTDLAMLFVEEI
ncbi:hypothetical protein STEG23_012099 [Scotinomys teguina]